MSISWACLFSLSLQAQDAKPTPIKSEENVLGKAYVFRSANGWRMERPFQFEPTTLPVTFVHRRANTLLQTESLVPFFEKVTQRRTKSVRVLQIGDSHVRGHVFPRELRYRLAEAWGSEAMVDNPIHYRTTMLAEETGVPGFIMSAISKNGVTLSYYEDESLLSQIADQCPDLLIISLGTNESHGDISAAEYQQQLQRFCHTVRQRCPETQFLITTPPGSHIGKGKRVKRRGRWVSTGGQTPNPRTAEIANTLREFALQNKMAVWDLYEMVGGSTYACENWKSAGLMNADGVHYTPVGYTLMGRMLAESILQAWNQYLEN